MEKEELINEEYERLAEAFHDLSDNQKILAEGLLKEAAFIRVTMKELKEYINKEGVKEKYKNGQNQYGYKDSTEAKYYDRLVVDYSRIIKQLNDMLPKNDKPKADDFDGFGE